MWPWSSVLQLKFSCSTDKISHESQLTKWATKVNLSHSDVEWKSALWKIMHTATCNWISCDGQKCAHRWREILHRRSMWVWWVAHFIKSRMLWFTHVNGSMRKFKNTQTTSDHKQLVQPCLTSERALDLWLYKFLGWKDPNWSVSDSLWHLSSFVMCTHESIFGCHPGTKKCVL